MSNVIEIGEQLRIRVEQDDSAPNPRVDADGWATGFVKLDRRGDSRYADVPAVHDDEHHLREAYDTFSDDWTTDGTGYLRRKHVAEDLVVRWAKIWLGLRVEYDAAHGGFWWVRMTEDWSTDWTGQGETIDAERKAYESWAEGAVYVVILERAVVWERKSGMLSEIGDRMITWEQEEALGGCYLTDTYTVWDVVDEHWSGSLDSEQEEVVREHLTTASPLVS